MNADASDAIRVVIDSLTQFAYGSIDPETTPYMGNVSLTPAQFNALRALLTEGGAG